MRCWQRRRSSCPTRSISGAAFTAIPSSGSSFRAPKPRWSTHWPDSISRCVPARAFHRWWPICARGGALMASANVVTITVTGKGGHASTPYLANDPMPVAAEIVQALQVMVTRRISTFDPVVITITKIRAGTTSNVIPEAVNMLGTLRAVSESGRSAAIAGIERIVSNIAAAHEMTATVTVEPGYPVTVNDDAFADFALDVSTELL